MVFTLTLRSLVHFELLFIRGKGPTSFFCIGAPELLQEVNYKASHLV